MDMTDLLWSERASWILLEFGVSSIFQVYFQYISSLFPSIDCALIFLKLMSMSDCPKSNVTCCLLLCFQFIFCFCVRLDVGSKPLLLIGMEGLWGCIVCVFIMGLIAYFMPGNDLGSFESLYDLLLMTFIFFFLSVFGYSLFGMLVKFMLHSVWRAILDNFCPIAVWASSLEIHYFASTSFGEVWTDASWTQVGGLIVFLYGADICNEPGDWQDSGSIASLDLSEECHDADDEWEDATCPMCEYSNRSWATALCYMGTDDMLLSCVYSIAMGDRKSVV